ncbi:hypothetical protein FEM48_Zijuj05G0066100 [Ziziphus jujuba var. spinosa]|uniref:Uncharacterized protein n=1 Tax=Ziziphus jujuba var. spinosa TaxID=714518 RepID=A0A978VDD9_ZIZJJ|nr:hypothetical protein FEM48_Zijuj05G0066100 [Ziziphus jujuba var. spinosa]
MVNLSELLIATSNNIVARCILGRRFQGDDELDGLSYWLDFEPQSNFSRIGPFSSRDGMLQMELTLDNLKAILLV